MNNGADSSEGEISGDIEVGIEGEGERDNVNVGVGVWSKKVSI